jgi:hypothetical protein
MRSRISRNILWCAGSDYLAAFVAAFWAEIDNPICSFNHIKVVLDHYHGIAVVPQAVQYH